MGGNYRQMHAGPSNFMALLVCRGGSLPEFNNAFSVGWGGPLLFYGPKWGILRTSAAPYYSPGASLLFARGSLRALQ